MDNRHFVSATGRVEPRSFTVANVSYGPAKAVIKASAKVARRREDVEVVEEALLDLEG